MSKWPISFTPSQIAATLGFHIFFPTIEQLALTFYKIIVVRISKYKIGAKIWGPRLRVWRRHRAKSEVKGCIAHRLPILTISCLIFKIYIIQLSICVSYCLPVWRSIYSIQVVYDYVRFFPKSYLNRGKPHFGLFTNLDLRLRPGFSIVD
jgi:hypothetical protein